MKINVCMCLCVSKCVIDNFSEGRRQARNFMSKGEKHMSKT